LPPDVDDCLFCRLFREGDHVHAAEGFVAIADIAPQAPVHLLVIPERCRRQCRPERRADRLPPPLARLGKA